MFNCNMLCIKKLSLRVKGFANDLTCVCGPSSVLGPGPAGSPAYATRDDEATGKIMTTSAFSSINLIPKMGYHVNQLCSLCVHQR